VTGRKLKLKARAERMAETRRRIVRAGYDLHRTMGPARKQFPMVVWFSASMTSKLEFGSNPRQARLVEGHANLSA
jgi:hypothetical protein